MIECKTDWSQLDIAQTIRAENALERINALVVNTRAAEARRDTCWREAKTGSKVATTLRYAAGARRGTRRCACVDGEAEGVRAAGLRELTQRDAAPRQAAISPRL